MSSSSKAPFFDGDQPGASLRKLGDALGNLVVLGRLGVVGGEGDGVFDTSEEDRFISRQPEILISHTFIASCRVLMLYS
jgi:hypothetical protein